jgi:hypothetical protein
LGLQAYQGFAVVFALSEALQSSLPMTRLFKKLNLGEIRAIHILSAPQSFDTELQALEAVKVNR